MSEAGLESLRWLAGLQRADEAGGHFVPIGSNGFYERDGERARFDQQPVEAQTMLLCRVEDRRGHSHLCVARSANGVDAWQIDPDPTLLPDPDHFPEELWGIEDPRITYVPELEKYAVVYTAFTRDGPGVALAFTEDFSQYER